MDDMITRRRILTTSAAALAVTISMPAVGAQANPVAHAWQAKIDSAFQIFDTYGFTHGERCRTLYIQPLNEKLADDNSIRQVLGRQIETSAFKQERLDLILTIGRNLEVRHGHDAVRHREYLATKFAGHHGLTLRQLMASGSRHDLYLAARHTNSFS
jgi:hypothetical protein